MFRLTINAAAEQGEMPLKRRSPEWFYSIKTQIRANYTCPNSQGNSQ